MITKKQILDEMLKHMTSAYDNGNIDDGGIHGGEEAADAILNLLQADVIKSVCSHKDIYGNDGQGWYCTQCGKPMEKRQTVL